MNALRVNQIGYVKVALILSEKKMPMQVELNNTELYPKFIELGRLCPVKLVLIF